jgi:uncharacterized membrane protein YidH (DUF202 family)
LIRTALPFVTFGLGMIAFFLTVAQTTHTEEALRLHQGAIRVGVALVAIGMVATLLVAVSHWTALSRLRRGEPLGVTDGPWPSPSRSLYRSAESTGSGLSSRHEAH